MIDLEACARSLVAPGKGILACDERIETINARLEEAGIEPSEQVRLAYRTLLLETPGIEEYLSGVSLPEELLASFAKSLHDRNIVPGVKAHEGYEAMSESPKEEVTKGLIGLQERLAEYRRLHHTGFATWRAPVHIYGDQLPTSLCIVENAKRLAMHARYVQETGMVPIVEFDILRDGTHSRVRAKAVTLEALSALVRALEDQSLDLSGVLLEVSMVLSGKESGHLDSPEEAAHDTLDVFEGAIPKNLLGLACFSKGQTPDQDTDTFRAVVQEGKKRKVPWPISFACSNTLEAEALSIWGGEASNVEAAREAFLARLRKVALAARGE